MKALGKNVAKLKTIINNQAGNPDSDAISKLEEVMESKLEEVGTTGIKSENYN